MKLLPSIFSIEKKKYNRIEGMFKSIVNPVDVIWHKMFEYRLKRDFRVFEEMSDETIDYILNDML